MKNKIVPIMVIVLVIVLVAIWIYPSNTSDESDNTEITGTAISDEEEEVEVESETIEEELDEISGEALIAKCILSCASNANNDLEKDIWKSICKQKYNLGEEKLREFIRTC